MFLVQQMFWILSCVFTKQNCFNCCCPGKLSRKYLVELKSLSDWTEWNFYLIYSNGQNTCLICSALSVLFIIWQLVDHFTHSTRTRCLYACMRNAYIICIGVLRPALCAIFDLSSLIQFNVPNAPILTAPQAFCYLHFIILLSNKFYYAVIHSNSRNNG